MKLSVQVPDGTALIVYVDADGNIIEAVEPDGKAPEFAAEGMSELSGIKFATAGEAAVVASAAVPPTETTGASGGMAPTTYASAAVKASCCWCKVGGQWYCYPSCC